MSSDKQIEFLYSAISEAQELIKYTETKVGYVVGLLSAYIAVVFLILENLVTYSENWSSIFWCLLAILLFLICFDIIVIARIIIPIKNPSTCFNNSQTELPTIEYYLASNEYKNVFFPILNYRKYKLKNDLDLFTKNIEKLQSKDIIGILTVELFKTSFIRNLKTDRLKILIYSILFTSIALIIFYIKYQIELNNLKQTCLYLIH